MFHQNLVRIAFPHPSPARKERLFPPLFENEGSPQAEFDEQICEQTEKALSPAYSQAGKHHAAPIALRDVALLGAVLCG